MAARADPPADRPVLLVADGTPELTAIAAALERRFGADWDVRAAASPDEGRAILEQVAAAGGAVALVIADVALGAEGGVEFVRAAHLLHRGAGRAVLVPMANAPAMGGAAAPVLRAAALGQLDLSILKGWVSPEEWLYPQVQEALSAWATAHRPRHEHVRVVGEPRDPRSHELRDLFTRNGLPFGFYAAGSDAGRRLLADHGRDASRLPVLVFFDGTALVAPDDRTLAAVLGVTTRPAVDRYDVAIVGAGPAGLAAAVYGASEGLRAIVVEARALGGQAGASSRIRNYLGFPRGVSGAELTALAYQQARVFGAEFLFTQQATAVAARGGDRVLRLDGGEVVARAVVIATGVSYRRLDVPALERLVGRGVFYGAAAAEARALAGEHVAVVGAGNSAGQAALHLARFAARVTVLARGDSLAASMSEYLIREIATVDRIDVRVRARVVDGAGDDGLDAIVVEDVATGRRDAVPVTAAFVLVGAEPHTGWLAGALERDGAGYLRTGPDVARERWGLARAPMLLETSLPGVFAAGDVRSGSVKRVAAAVGEGAVAIGAVHRYLAEGP